MGSISLYNNNGVPVHRILNEYSPGKSPAKYTSVQVADMYMYEYRTYIEDLPLSKTTEEYFFNQDTVRVITQYGYNSQGHLTSEEKNGKEWNTQTKIQYIPDIPPQNRTSLQTAMYQQGRIKYPVKMQTTVKRPSYLNYLLTNGKSYEYEQIYRNNKPDFDLKKIWETNLTTPIYRADFAFDDLLGKIVFSYEYDLMKRIKTVQEKTGPVTIYLWGYDYRYPIAKIENAAYNDVAYTSFEDDFSGSNWSFNSVSGTSDTTYSHTGTECFILGSGNITKTNISSGKEYIVSYWSRSGTVNITNSTASSIKTGKTINGWTYYEHQFTSTSTSLAISGNGKVIDDLRLYPASAMMTTYTYKPMVGITSETDPSERTVHYQYDNFGRLIQINDEEGNVLNEYQYHYAE